MDGGVAVRKSPGVGRTMDPAEGLLSAADAVKRESAIKIICLPVR